jgi:hypothetical protein
MRRSSDDLLRNIQVYDNEPTGGNRARRASKKYLIYNNLSTGFELDVNLPRRRPSLDNLKNIEGTQDPNGRAAGGGSPHFRQGRQVSYSIEY